LQRAKEIVDKRPELRAPYFKHLGDYEYYSGRAAKSIEYYLQAENALNASGNEGLRTKLYAEFANVYEEISDFNRALEYLLRMKPQIDAKGGIEMIDYYNMLGWIYYRDGQFDKALHTIKLAERNCEVLSPGNPDVAYPIGNLGLIYTALGNLDSAAFYSKLAIDLFDLLGQDIGVAEAYNNLGTICLLKNEPEKAEAYFLKGLDLTSETDVDVYEMANALLGLNRSLRERDPKRALAYFEQYSELKIKLLHKEETIKALQLEAEFYQDRNRDQIQELEYESRLKSLQLERTDTQMLFVTLALVIMFIVSGLIFFYWLQRKRMVRSLEESNEINQRIISMISHDFRGPLNNVKLTLELLQSDDIDMSEFAILSKDLYRQSAELALMFDSFVGWAISQRDGYNPARIPFKWSDVVEEVISISQPLAKLKNIRLVLKAHSSVHLETDRMASSLILRNLLSNAIKYSHHDQDIEIEYHQDKEMVYTTIRDHGIGMSHEKLQRILTTGDGSIVGTNNEYGVGLGLRMVIKYVKGIGGSITAESKENVGTTFVIAIPCLLE
jgi:signal transduction histidine kinase